MAYSATLSKSSSKPWSWNAPRSSALASARPYARHEAARSGTKRHGTANEARRRPGEARRRRRGGGTERCERRGEAERRGRGQRNGRIHVRKETKRSNTTRWSKQHASFSKRSKIPTHYHFGFAHDGVSVELAHLCKLLLDGLGHRVELLHAELVGAFVVAEDGVAHRLFDLLVRALQLADQRLQLRHLGGRRRGRGRRGRGSRRRARRRPRVWKKQITPSKQAYRENQTRGRQTLMSEHLRRVEG